MGLLRQGWFNRALMIACIALPSAGAILTACHPVAGFSSTESAVAASAEASPKAAKSDRVAKAAAAGHLRILVTGNSIAEARPFVPMRFTWSYRLLEMLEPGSDIDIETVPIPEREEVGYRLHSESIELLNTGIAGDDTIQVSQRLTQELDEFHPDVVLFVTGTNDIAHRVPEADVRREMADMYQELAERNIDAYFATVPEADWGHWQGADTLPRLAEMHNDWLRTWKPDRCVDLEGSLDTGMLVDSAHYGKVGNLKIAKLFGRVIWPLVRF